MTRHPVRLVGLQGDSDTKQGAFQQQSLASGLCKCQGRSGARTAVPAGYCQAPRCATGMPAGLECRESGSRSDLLDLLVDSRLVHLERRCVGNGYAYRPGSRREMLSGKRRSLPGEDD